MKKSTSQTSIDSPKKHHRTDMIDRINTSLGRIRQYDNENYDGKFFNEVHNSLNTLVTTETSQQMRARLSQVLRREIEEKELLEDYFPAMALVHYISLCHATRYLMIEEGLEPLKAVERAAELIIPADYVPAPIDFTKSKKKKNNRDRDLDRLEVMNALNAALRAFESSLGIF